jgi:hypothetical protein
MSRIAGCVVIRRQGQSRRVNDALRVWMGAARMRKRVVLGGVVLGALAALWPRRARALQRVEARSATFDPATVARLEVAGWRAYYARNPFAALAVLWRLTRGQFALPLGAALRAAYFALRGQAAFAGERGRAERALPWMTRFYAVTPRRDGASAAALARAEIEYWVRHRRVVGQPDQTSLEDALAELHALLFGGTPATQRASAHERTLACQAVDRITGRVSSDITRDWQLAEMHLRRAYELAGEVAHAEDRKLVAR